MQDEKRVRKLERRLRLLSLVAAVAFVVAIFGFAWSMQLANRMSGRTVIEVLSVRSLHVKNDDGDVVAYLSAESGSPAFYMHGGKSGSFDIHMKDDGPIVTLWAEQEQPRIMLTTQEDAGGAVRVFNHQNQLCATLAADEQGCGIVKTHSATGEPLAAIRRGEDNLGSIVVFGKDGKSLELAARADDEE